MLLVPSHATLYIVLKYMTYLSDYTAVSTRFLSVIRLYFKQHLLIKCMFYAATAAAATVLLL
jgi:hypothetical protein